jgi:hypothetical protein
MSMFEQLFTVPGPQGFYEASDPAHSHDHATISGAHEQPQAKREQTKELERNKVLPALELSSTDSQAPAAQSAEHWMSRAAHLFVGLTTDKPSDLKGHPIKAAAEALLGASAGADVAVGLMAIGPEVAIAAAAAGLGAAAYERHKTDAASSAEQHVSKTGI